MYGTFRTMSTERLTPTSYLVLGLLAREGPSTPYDLEQHVKATLGNFWSFPHPPVQRAAPPGALGLVTETRETEGRRRRLCDHARGYVRSGRLARSTVGCADGASRSGAPSALLRDMASDEAKRVDSPSGNSRSTRRSSPPTVMPIGTNGARMDLSGASGRSSTGAARPCRWVCGTRGGGRFLDRRRRESRRGRRGEARPRLTPGGRWPSGVDAGSRSY